MRSDRLLQAAFDRARTGRPAVLSWLFRRVIPFNAPHGLRIAAVATGPDGTAVAVVLPWRRRNRNHIGTVHACALATAAEFATGLGLVEAGPLRAVVHCAGRGGPRPRRLRRPRRHRHRRRCGRRGGGGCADRLAHPAHGGWPYLCRLKIR